MDGWVNVDGFDESYPLGRVDPTAPILSLDLTGPHPFSDAHWRYGYAEDFLEHLTQAESLLFLAEATRTFQAGGVLRLSFPGLGGVLAKHLAAVNYQAVSTLVKDAFTVWHHVHFYCFESLALVVKHMGWADIYEVPFGESKHELLRGLDTRFDQVGLNLMVEIVR